MFFIVFLLKTGIGEQEVTCLFEALGVNSSLLKLRLGLSLMAVKVEMSFFIGNAIGDSGLRFISEALKVNSSLADLYLDMSFVFLFLIARNFR